MGARSTCGGSPSPAVSPHSAAGEGPGAAYIAGRESRRPGCCARCGWAPTAPSMPRAFEPAAQASTKSLPPARLRVRPVREQRGGVWRRSTSPWSARTSARASPARPRPHVPRRPRSRLLSGRGRVEADDVQGVAFHRGAQHPPHISWPKPAASPVREDRVGQAPIRRLVPMCEQNGHRLRREFDVTAGHQIRTRLGESFAEQACRVDNVSSGHRDDSIRECCERFTRRITRWPRLRPDVHAGDDHGDRATLLSGTELTLPLACWHSRQQPVPSHTPVQPIARTDSLGHLWPWHPKVACRREWSQRLVRPRCIFAFHPQRNEVVKAGGTTIDPQRLSNDSWTCAASTQQVLMDVD